jgi:hypothetical protein
MFERPIAPEGTIHRTNDETKDGTTSDGTAHLSEEKQFAPRPSILAPAIAVPLQPRREETEPLMETHVPSSGLAASAQRLLFDLEDKSRSSLPKPKLQRTGPAPINREQGLL